MNKILKCFKGLLPASGWCYHDRNSQGVRCSVFGVQKIGVDCDADADTWETAMKKAILDPDEKELLESFERGEWTPIKHREVEMAKLQDYARNTLQKNKRPCPRRRGQ